MYITIMELGPQTQNRYGLLGPDSIMVVYMKPLGIGGILTCHRRALIYKPTHKCHKNPYPKDREHHHHTLNRRKKETLNRLNLDHAVAYKRMEVAVKGRRTSALSTQRRRLNFLGF